MRRLLAILTLALSGLIGCAPLSPRLVIPRTTVHGITPTTPKASRWNRPARVDSLRPTFRWQAGEPGTQYDFVIFEALGGFRIIGKEIYYRKGLRVPEHTVEITLQPKAYYFWSVRVRQGASVGEWSWVEYWEKIPFLPVSDRTPFLFFIFQTPEE